MQYPKYSESHAITKVGVNYVRAITEAANSIFTEIHQENDIGIDALIELIQNERPTGKIIGVQIKSGNSYYDERRNECVIPVGTHQGYWLQYPLPVLGIVYIPSRKCSFWVDLKNHLKNSKTVAPIRFHCTKFNTFDTSTFKRIFVPHILGETPIDFSYEEAVDLFHSGYKDESNLGLYLLSRLHSDKNEVWDEFITFLRNTPTSNIPGVLVYYLAHIPWHGDILGGKDKITAGSRIYARNLIARFTKADVIKLLGVIDENGVSRGTIGQSVEAIVSIVSNSDKYLVEIVQDNSLSLPIREYAALIYTYNNQDTEESLHKSVSLLRVLATDSNFAGSIIEYILEYHGLPLYS